MELKDTEIQRAVDGSRAAEMALDESNKLLKEKMEELEKEREDKKKSLEAFSAEMQKLRIDHAADIEKIQEARSFDDVQSFGMGWKELRGKVVEEFKLNLDHIKPSLEFEDPVPSPTEEGVEDDGDEVGGDEGARV